MGFSKPATNQQAITQKERKRTMEKENFVT